MRLDPIMRHSRITQTPISPWLGALLILLGVAFTSFAHSLEQITYYHNDALGSPVAATDATGNLIWQESYLPYGQRQTYESRETDCSSGICVAIETQADEKVWYTGKFEETRLGLVYLGARWYDPEIGRFLSVDPVSYNASNYDSFNRYAYANNNPYRYVDPDGRESEEMAELRATRAPLTRRAQSIADTGTAAMNVASDEMMNLPKTAILGGLLGKIGKFAFSRLGTKNAVDPKRTKHIFRDKKGHLSDTPKNRKLLEGVADNPKTTLGNDKFGNTWSAQNRPDGSQVWTQTRDGKIINGGVNQTPRSFDPKTGLSASAKPRQ